MTADLGYIDVNLLQRLTGFACVIDEDDRILMGCHERLGVLRWELAWPVVALIARRAYPRGCPLLFEASHARTNAG